MKWMFISLLVAALPVQAAEQYTESSCILLKHQVNDYKRRLGIISLLYVKTKSNFDTHCQKPITAKSSKIVSLSNKPIQQMNSILSIKYLESRNIG